MNFMRTIHRWVGLILGIQLFLWMLSGLVMGILPHDLVTGQHYKSTTSSVTQLEKNNDVKDWVNSEWSSRYQGSVISVSLQLFEGRSVYKVISQEGVLLIDARNGNTITIDEAMARRRALEDYSGPGKIIGTHRLTTPRIIDQPHAMIVFPIAI